jgi:hypothetical protein
MSVEERFPKSPDAPVGIKKHVFLTGRVTPQKRLFDTDHVSGGRRSHDQKTSGAPGFSLESSQPGAALGF